MKTIEAMGFPLFVKWYITQRCNLRCTHCYLTDYTQAPSLGRITPIIDFLGTRGVAGIVLIGGEPVVRSDLPEIVRRIAAYGIRTSIATNATLIDAGKARTLISAGASQFQVSLEGATAPDNDAIRGAGTFAGATAGIAALVEAGGDVRIAFTLNGENHTQLRQMFALASQLGAAGIKLNAFIPIGTGRLLERSRALSAPACRWIADTIVACASEFPDLKVNAGAFVKRVAMPARRAAADTTFGCGAGTTSMIINSDLTLSACDMLVEEDRTDRPIASPADLEASWLRDPLFQRWRGQSGACRTRTIRSFDDVHRHGCHVAYNVYRGNLFSGGA